MSTNYRLSPHVRFPGHLLDCKRALKWVRDNAASFGGDPHYVVVSAAIGSN